MGLFDWAKKPAAPAASGIETSGVASVAPIAPPGVEIPASAMAPVGAITSTTEAPGAMTPITPPGAEVTPSNLGPHILPVGARTDSTDAWNAAKLGSMGSATGTPSPSESQAVPVEALPATPALVIAESGNAPATAEDDEPKVPDVAQMFDAAVPTPSTTSEATPPPAADAPRAEEEPTDEDEPEAPIVAAPALVAEPAPSPVAPVEPAPVAVAGIPNLGEQLPDAPVAVEPPAEAPQAVVAPPPPAEEVSAPTNPGQPTEEVSGTSPSLADMISSTAIEVPAGTPGATAPGVPGDPPVMGEVGPTVTPDNVTPITPAAPTDIAA